MTVRTVDLLVEPAEDGPGYDVWLDPEMYPHPDSYSHAEYLGRVSKAGIRGHWIALGWDGLQMPAEFRTRRDAIAALTVED